MNDMNQWLEMEMPISDVKNLLDDGYLVEVDSPDGYVQVTQFVDKGDWAEYVLTTEDGCVVRCNTNHLFETNVGWVAAKDMVGKPSVVVTRVGLREATVAQTGNIIPIVDIQVNHPNHRYYTNGVSSHNTGVGKSLFMCHHAAACLTQNLDVLYITCEMAEERIAERIDANLMDIALDDLHALPADIYFKKMAKIKMTANVNSYTFIKAIAEEIRALAQEFDVPIFSATQSNRQGLNNSDVGLENTSESFGLPATADLFLVLIATEELDEQGQIMVKQLKNRYADISRNKKFVVGIDRSRMKLFDVSSPIVDDRGFGNCKDPVNSTKINAKSLTAKPNYDDWDFNQ
jgi:hypothetical protein